MVNSKYGEVLQVGGVIHDQHLPARLLDGGLSNAIAAKLPLVNVRDYGAVGDGTTDDTAAFASALAVGHKVVVPKGYNFHLPTNVTIPSGVTVEGEGYGAAVSGTGFLLGNNTKVRSLRFIGVAANANDHALDFSNVTAVSDFEVTGNWFENYGQTIYVRGNVDGTTHERGRISGNTFTGCVLGVFAIRGNHFRITDNTFTTGQPSAQHILFYAGSGNVIANNVIKNGTTGISFVTRYDLNSSTPVMHNTITGNEIEGVTQESISFDLNASTGATTTALEQDSIGSKSASGTTYTVTLGDSAWSGTVRNYTDHYMIWMTGNLAGCALRISAHSHAVFTLDISRTQFERISAADKVVIGVPFLYNTVTGNTIDSRLSTTCGIFLYGLCVNNTVTGNVVRGKGAGGLVVASLHGLVRSTGSAINVNPAAPSGYNTISGNVAHATDIAQTYMDYAASVVYTPTGNQFSGNASLNGLIIASDSFTRADSATTLGNSDTRQLWEPKNGSVWGIASNRAYRVTDGAAGQNVAAVNTGKADCTVSATLYGGSGIGLGLRTSDGGDNMLFTNAFNLYRRQAGVNTIIGSAFSTSFSSGDRVTAVMSGSTITIKRNGSTVGTFTETFNQTEPRHGLRAAPGDTGTFADLVVA